MVRSAVFLFAAALLCCRHTALLGLEGSPDAVEVMVVEPTFPDLVLATRFSGAAANGTVTDRWRARSSDAGWSLVALPEPRSSVASYPWPDLWLGVARKTRDHENYDFVLLRWAGLRPTHAQAGRLEGGRDAAGERRRGLRPWQAQRLDLRTGDTTQLCGELVLGPGEPASQ